MSNVKNVAGFPGYEVSSSGEVFSSRRGQRTQMSPSVTNGYAKVTLANGKERGNFQVHRLVALAFIKNPKKLEIVNHIDGDKLNNDVSNLEWTSRKGNGKHFSQKLAPKYAVQRKLKKENDMKTRLSIINFTHSACTSNPELFYSVYQTVMETK